jgi:hypothetical protein
MQHRATLKYTEHLVARAVRSFWLRAVGYSGVVAALAILAFLAWRITDGDRSWVVGVIAACALVSVVMPAALYVVQYRNSMSKLREMKQPIAELVANGDSLTLSSDLGSSTLKWGGVTEVWCFRDFWLLLISRSQFVTIPLDGMSEEVKSFVLEKVKAAGGKVAV